MLNNTQIQDKLSHYGISVTLPIGKKELKEQIDTAYDYMVQVQTYESMVEHCLLVRQYEKEYGYDL